MTNYVYDTFTAADNTDIESHTGETGATWTRDVLFGQGNGGGRTFGIFSNKLRRLTTAENAGADAGNSLIRPSGTLPTGQAQFSIEFPVTFAVSGANARVEIYELANNPGNPETLMYFGQTGLYLNATGGATVLFTITVGTEYLIRYDVNGTAVSAYIDGVLIRSGTRATKPTEPFGLNVFDSDATGDARINSFRIFTPDTTTTASVGRVPQRVLYRIELMGEEFYFSSLEDAERELRRFKAAQMKRIKPPRNQ